MKRRPPSKEMCLLLAQMYWAMPRRTAAQTKLSWDYLVIWGFYEMYEEGWW